MNEFRLGVCALFKGFELIVRPGVKRYAALPFAINAVVFALIIAFGAHEFALVVNWIAAQLPSWLRWLRWLLWILFGGAALLTVFYCFAFMACVVGAPFNFLLAARVDKLLNARPMKGPNESFWRGVGADILSALQVLRYQLLGTALAALVALALLLLPGLNLLVPVLWFIVGAWMLALGYSDPVLGNRGYRFSSQRCIFNRHKSRLLGFGCVTAFVTLIPVVNLIVMPAAVAGAVWLWQDIVPRPADVDR